MKVHTNSMRFNFNTNFFCLNCSANWANSKRHIHIFSSKILYFESFIFFAWNKEKDWTILHTVNGKAENSFVVPKRKRKVLWTLFSFSFNSNLHLKFNALFPLSLCLSLSLCLLLILLLLFISLHFLLQSSSVDYPQSFWYAFKCLGFFSNLLLPFYWLMCMENIQKNGEKCAMRKIKAMQNPTVCIININLLALKRGLIVFVSLHPMQLHWRSCSVNKRKGAMNMHSNCI